MVYVIELFKSKEDNLKWLMTQDIKMFTFKFMKTINSNIDLQQIHIFILFIIYILFIN